MAAWTGLRSGELAGLQFGDIDLGRNPTVSVQRTALVVHGTPATGETAATGPHAVYDSPRPADPEGACPFPPPPLRSSGTT